VTVGRQAPRSTSFPALDRDVLESSIPVHAGELLLCAGWLTGDPDVAWEVVRTTYVRATARVGTLTDGSRLREWLHAILRNECALQPAPAIQVFPEGSNLEDDADVWGAAQGLDAPEREIFALHVCSGLDPVQLSNVMGIRLGNATVRIARMRQELHRSLTLYHLAREGFPYCGGLQEIVGDPGAPFRAGVRARLDAHATQCWVCRDWPEASDAALARFSALPAATVPPGYPAQILIACRARQDIDSRPPVWSWQADGFPLPIDGAAPVGIRGLLRRRLIVGGLVGLLCLAVVLGVVGIGSLCAAAVPRPSAAVPDAPHVSLIVVGASGIAPDGKVDCRDRYVYLSVTATGQAPLTVVARWSPDGTAWSSSTLLRAPAGSSYEGTVGPLTALAGGRAEVLVSDSRGGRTTRTLPAALFACR